MPLQPPSGSRDLNPQQVELNQHLVDKLSNTYKLWGYEEVSPPTIERINTLNAGGGIDSNEIVKLIAEEPLALRPEMTVCIARVASTRLKKKVRPLRLFTKGSVFKTKEAVEGGIYIEENLQSGVELFGVKNINAEIELLTLLLESLNNIDSIENLKPTLLIGHTKLIDLIISNINTENKNNLKRILLNYNLIKLNNINLNSKEKELIYKIQKARGNPQKILEFLNNLYGSNETINNLDKLFTIIKPIADKNNTKLQLDPTFGPRYEIYTGLVFQLVCQAESNSITIARGGRYDELVDKFDINGKLPYGIGFSFAIDNIREILTKTTKYKNNIKNRGTLIAYSNESNLEKAIEIQSKLHIEDKIAIIELDKCNNLESAREKMKIRNCDDIIWLD